MKKEYILIKKLFGVFLSPYCQYYDICIVKEKLFIEI